MLIILIWCWWDYDDGDDDYSDINMVECWWDGDNDGDIDRWGDKDEIDEMLLVILIWWDDYCDGGGGGGERISMRWWWWYCWYGCWMTWIKCGDAHAENYAPHRICHCCPYFPWQRPHTHWTLLWIGCFVSNSRKYTPLLSVLSLTKRTDILFKWSLRNTKRL